MPKKETSQENHKSLNAALLAFQMEHGPVVAYDSKGYGYSYASMDAILKSTWPVLHKHGLVIRQEIVGWPVDTGGKECIAVVTTLSHPDSGEEKTSTLGPIEVTSMKGMSSYQAMGCAATYLRRYSYSALVGITTTADIDAAEPKQQKPVNSATPAKPAENQPYPSTPVKCPRSTCEVEGPLTDKSDWAKVGHDANGILWAKCGGCGHSFKVWE